VVTVGVPVPFLLQRSVDAAGNSVPVWRVFWDLFGASNQLLAALTLIGLTVWLWRTRRSAWVFVVLGVPTVLMYVMSMWALLRIIRIDLAAHGLTTNPVPWVAMLLVALALMMVIDAIVVFVGPAHPPSPQLQPALT
jgi:carbon starvation protein